MSSVDGTFQHKASSVEPLCAGGASGGTTTHKAPLAGSLCAFDAPSGPGDAALSRLAGRQHWCLHRLQLVAAGIGRRGIAGRVDRGQLHRIVKDVYLSGRQDRDPLSLTMAVALHFRGEAVASHGCAAWIWELSSEVPSTIDVTTCGHRSRGPAGVILHRTGYLHPDDIRWRKGIPVTSPARSLIDFAGSGASVPRVESALAMLRRLHHDADRQIRSTLERLPANHPGVPLVRRLLELPPGQLALTKSIYERRLRRLLRLAGLSAPVSNQVVAGRERDLVWPHAKLIVEFDGWEFHREKFEDDRRRDAAASAAGWRVMRITADRVDTEPFAVIAEITAALAHAE